MGFIVDLIGGEVMKFNNVFCVIYVYKILKKWMFVIRNIWICWKILLYLKIWEFWVILVFVDFFFWFKNEMLGFYGVFLLVVNVF